MHKPDTSSPAARPVPPSLAAAARAELQRHAPFNRMAQADIDWMIGRLSLVYFADGGSVLAPDDGVPQYVFIVRHGSVVGLDPQTNAQRWRLNAGEAFPLGALLGARAVTTRYHAEGDTFCWRMPAEDFATLLERSAAFREFCTQRLSALLATSERRMQREYAEQASGDPLTQPLRELLRKPPVCCAQEATVAQALSHMREAQVSSIVVCDDEGRAAGIFTLRDLRDRIAGTALSGDLRIRDVMTASPTTLPADALALDAALLLARHGFHHVIVTEGEKVVGVVSESDLFTLRRVGMTAVSAAIRQARTPDALARCAADTRQLAGLLLAQGVAAAQLTRVISALNDALTARIVALECEAADIAADGFCWLALGSEGRGEQTLATDQDNAIVFTPTPDQPLDVQRARLVAFAKRINDALAGCGFPLCKGGVMASNPNWCASVAEWRSMFSAWIDRPEAPALLNAAIFFDFRPLFGAVTLAAELRGWLARYCRNNAVFLRLMADNALRNEPPLGVVREFAVETHGATKDAIDLKRNCITPFVDAARILALAAGETATGTAQRFRSLVEHRRLFESEVNAWVEAFEFVQRLRLRHQHAQWRRGETLDNFLQPDQLNELDRRILKEALRQARKAQQRLRLDYRL